MPELLAAASILVATAGAMSLLLVLPAAGLAETAGEHHAASRARIWLAALVLPPLIGTICAVAALMLHAQGFVASPHEGGQRPHLCLVPLHDAPAGAYRLSIFAWIALILVVLTLLRLVFGTIASHLLRRLALTNGAPVPGLERGCLVNEVRLSRLIAFSAGLARPVVVLSTSLLRALDSERLAAIVAHERAHCRRRDNLASLVADICVVVQALMPTAHYYRHQWRAASEAAADDAALGAGVAPEVLHAALQSLRGEAPRTVSTPTLVSLLIPDLPVTDQRLARLEALTDADPAQARAARALFWAVGTAAVLLVAVLLVVSSQSVQDTLFCAAEQFTRATR